jgi:hypothetical protein
VAFYFDNGTGLNHLAACHLNVTMKLKHGILIQAICQIVYKLYNEHSIQVQFCKVKGHKADVVQFNQLSCLEQLIKLMDNCAIASVE